ncbi:MAG: hypothetical protein ACD_9C00208G0006 [uncultured bacterium]|nr:MAG: hypothetical protein ACD_9C00208G0006 [uncultured bacterium]
MKLRRIGAFVCLLVVTSFFSGCSFDNFKKENKSSDQVSKAEKIDSQYYEGIVEYRCRNLAGSKKQCCIESVNDMKSANAKDTFDTVDWVTREKCSVGNVETRRNCDGSLSWCIPDVNVRQEKNQITVLDCKNDKKCLIEKAKKCEGASGYGIYKDGEYNFSVNHEIRGKNTKGECMYSGNIGTAGGDKYFKALGTTIECVTSADNLSKIFENGGFEKGIIEYCSGSFVNFIKPYYKSF